ncbi:hypothetical protein BC941DRAFT_472850 [Chlamydoabsidia padenii]|nr:hypothetical protein BC941DRAFT_472850 [Chlamydoabsidia padenii]
MSTGFHQQLSYKNKLFTDMKQSSVDKGVDFDRFGDWFFNCRIRQYFRMVLKYQDVDDLMTKQLLDAPIGTYILADGD